MAQGTDALPFPIGFTYFNGGTTNTTDGAWLEGREYIVPDLDYSRSTAPGQLEKSRAYWGTATNFKKVRIVRNVSGVTLYPRALVTFKSGQFGKQVDGYARTLGAGPAFPVDEFIPIIGGLSPTGGGVPANDLFYIVVAGTAEVLTDPGAGATDVFSAGSILVAQTVANSTYSMTQMATLAGGRAIIADFSSAGVTGATLANQAMFRIGVALSASTTANTNVLTDGRKLVNLSGHW